MNDYEKIRRTCESLVHQRFSFKGLEKELNKRFNSNGHIHYQEEQNSDDFILAYCIDEENAFDIYFLYLRDRNYLYVTEIGNEIY